MNNRIIRKTMFDSPRICSLNLLERYILIGLLAYVNDRGNGWWSPERIRGSILTGIIKASDKKIEDALRKLADKKIIYPYSEDDIRYFHIIGWRDKGSIIFQKLDHPQPSSEIPLCPHFIEDQFLGKTDTMIDLDGYDEDEPLDGGRDWPVIEYNENEKESMTNESKSMEYNAAEKKSDDYNERIEELYEK